MRYRGRLPYTAKCQAHTEIMIAAQLTTTDYFKTALTYFVPYCVSTYATGGTLLKDGWYAGIPLPRNNACMIAHTACIAYTRRP